MASPVPMVERSPGGTEPHFGVKNVWDTRPLKYHKHMKSAIEERGHSKICIYIYAIVNYIYTHTIVNYILVVCFEPKHLSDGSPQISNRSDLGIKFYHAPWEATF